MGTCLHCIPHPCAVNYWFILYSDGLQSVLFSFLPSLIKWGLGFAWFTDPSSVSYLKGSLAPIFFVWKSLTKHVFEGCSPVWQAFFLHYIYWITKHDLFLDLECFFFVCLVNVNSIVTSCFSFFLHFHTMKIANKWCDFWILCIFILMMIKLHTQIYMSSGIYVRTVFKVP